MKLFDKIYEIAKNQRILFWTFLAMAILPNFIMFFTESTSVLTRIINILLPLGFYWYALTLNKKPGRMFWWLFIFMFIDAFQIVLLYLFGESPIAVDMFLNVVTTNVTEATELLTNLLPAVIFVVIIYVTGIVFSIFSLFNKEELPHSFRRAHKRIALGILIVSAILLGVNYGIDKKFKIQNDIFPVNGFYNLVLSGVRTTQSIKYESASKDFTYKAQSTHTDSIPEVYVLVVGETARADNFGIYGYERNTTPLLQAMADSIVSFYDAITMSNTTHKSVPLLLTSVGCEDDFDQVYKRKGIISAYGEAGYKTAFYSNQRRNHSLIDFLGCEAQDVNFLKDDLPLTAQLSDEELLKPLKKKLDEHTSGKLFIVLHCYGSHFNYKDRYDKGTGVFLPDNVTSAKKKFRNELLNAYDNTIYHTDILLSGIINLLKQKQMQSAMIYVSDHGEDIFDDDRGRFLHASPLPTYYQLRVPFIVWASQEWKETYADKWQQLTEHRNLPISTNRITFHTMLDISGVTSPYYKEAEALTSESFKVTPRRYVNDHNEYRTMDDAGLKDLDIEQFRLHRLQFP